MECPYCHENMLKGYISALRDPLKWIEKSRNKGAFISQFQRRIKLTAWPQNQIKTFYCENCKKMIFDAVDLS